VLESTRAGVRLGTWASGWWLLFAAVIVPHLFPHAPWEKNGEKGPWALLLSLDACTETGW